MANARTMWRLAYRAARLACRNRDDLRFTPLAAVNWTETPRGPAEMAIANAAAGAIGYANFGPTREHFQVLTGVIPALRPVEPMRDRLRVAFFNRFGMLSPWRLPSTLRSCPAVSRWHVLDARRADLTARLDARGALRRDPGGWIRAVDFSRQEAAA